MDRNVYDSCDFCGATGIPCVGVGPSLPEVCGGGILEVMSRCLKCRGYSSMEEYEKGRLATQEAEHQAFMKAEREAYEKAQAEMERDYYGE